MASYTVYPGQFLCQECKVEVRPLRLYAETKSLRLWTVKGEATWMCSKKHLSKVDLIPQKKKKKDFDND